MPVSARRPISKIRRSCSTIPKSLTNHLYHHTFGRYTAARICMGGTGESSGRCAVEESPEFCCSRRVTRILLQQQSHRNSVAAEESPEFCCSRRVTAGKATAGKPQQKRLFRNHIHIQEQTFSHTKRYTHCCQFKNCASSRSEAAAASDARTRGTGQCLSASQHRGLSRHGRAPHRSGHRLARSASETTKFCETNLRRTAQTEPLTA